MKNRIKVKGKGGFIGCLVIRQYDAKTGKLEWESPIIKNRIISGSTGYGRNLVLRQLAGDTTFPLEITAGAIGTGSNPPADSDTGLQTEVTDDFEIGEVAVANDQMLISMFIPDANLANGVYTEFGLKCGSRLFSRVLISPTYTKLSGKDTTVDYTIILSAA